MSSKTSCFSCGLDFARNIDAFVAHMSDAHAGDQIKCTICSEDFSSGSEYSMHYIYRHIDENLFAGLTDIVHENRAFDYASSLGPSTSSPVNGFVPQASNTCPVCSLDFPIDMLNDHVNSHFEDGLSTSVMQSNNDFLLAKQLEETENSITKASEEKAFRDLQKKYGMDELGSYKQQGTSAYENAYNKGKMTLSQLYEQKSRLAVNQVAGVEDTNYAVKGGPVYMPSIPKIQQLIESAWAKGFDQIGKEQLNGKLANTRKWIGATEATCLFASFRIKCNIVDFWQPSGPDNNHPMLLKWVYEYFKERRLFTPPLYLQHEGHSRTIIGAERTRSGRYNLIILDPSATRLKILRLVKSTDLNDLKILRKNSKDLRHRQFQIVCINDVMKSDNEFESYKTKVDLIKIPSITK